MRQALVPSAPVSSRHQLCARARPLSRVAIKVNCPILRDWRGGLGGGAAHRTRALAQAQLSHSGSDTVGEWVGRKVESGVGAVISGGFAMSLQPQQPLPRVPEQTARIARAAFPKGIPYLTLRDTLGTIFEDGHFADLYPKQGQPACPPWR